MTVDTSTKRAAALGFGSVGLNLHVLRIPNGIVSDSDRQALIDLYGGWLHDLSAALRIAPDLAATLSVAPAVLSTLLGVTAAALISEAIIGSAELSSVQRIARTLMFIGLIADDLSAILSLELMVPTEPPAAPSELSAKRRISADLTDTLGVTDDLSDMLSVAPATLSAILSVTED